MEIMQNAPQFEMDQFGEKEWICNILMYYFHKILWAETVYTENPWPARNMDDIHKGI